MRWERLFDDLEGQVADEALLERDALVDELRDDADARREWWRELGGDVRLRTAAGEVDGRLVTASATVLHLASPRRHVVLPTSAVLEVTATGRAEPPGPLAGRIGWRVLVRAMQRDLDRVGVTMLDARRTDGLVVRVGADHLVVRDDAGTDHLVPWTGVAWVSCPS